jgi:hypothetical protein
MLRWLSAYRRARASIDDRENVEDVDPVATCRACGLPVPQRPHEANTAYEIRRRSGYSLCRRDCLGPSRPLVFPGADVTTWAEAIAYFPRCDRDGGIWRVVDEGYSCFTCPRRLRVGEALAALARRGLGER